jgi:hypothetical protein
VIATVKAGQQTKVQTTDPKGQKSGSLSGIMNNKNVADISNVVFTCP